MAADKKPGPDAVTSDVTFDPAVAWFQKRLGMTRAQVNRLTLDARRKVFFVTGLSDLELIKSVQDSLARSIENGSTFEEWKKEVKEKKLFQGPEFTHRRLETIFRTNMQNAFATGRYMEMTAPAVLKRRPYWRFSAVRDGRTTKVCAAAHGTILPANHPWWKTHIPPLHFNCRSTFVPMTEKDAKAAGITKTPTELDSALGFGNPPDGVPADAKDLPTEEERQAAEKASEEVQTAVEERQNASSELTTAKHEKTMADRKLKTAEKELLRAPQEEVPERKKDVEEAKKASKAAEKHVEKAKKNLEKKEKHVEKVTAANDGKPRSWTLVPERLKRLAKGVAAPAVELWKKILAVLAGGDLAALGRGATVRSLKKEVADEFDENFEKTERKLKEKALKERREKLRKIKFTDIPEGIRENAKHTAKAMGVTMMTEPENVEEALLKTNPGYSFNNNFQSLYTHNCQRCVIAFEARCRGLDVAALPIFQQLDEISKNSGWADAFVGGKILSVSGASGKEIKANIEKIIKNSPDGSRFIIRVKQKRTNGSGGHVISAFQKNGEIFYVDSQPRGRSKQFDDSKIFSRILTQGVKILRVDNLKFSDKISKFVRSSPWIKEEAAK